MNVIKEEIKRLIQLAADEDTPREQLLTTLVSLEQISLGLADLVDECDANANVNELATAV